jgi:hypothetical protein
VDFFEERQKGSKKTRMAERNARANKNIRPSEDALGGSEKKPKGDLGEQRRPKKREGPRQGKNEAGAEGGNGSARRGEVRKVARMVKRLKKNIEEPARECRAEAESSQDASEGWKVQQQETVAAYAPASGMEPKEVLQALVNSMEKTLRKERADNPAGQALPPTRGKQRQHNRVSRQGEFSRNSAG